MTNVFTRYISGPMRGLPDYNYPTFNEAEDFLCEEFPEHRVLNPARNFDGNKDLAPVTYMTKDFQQVMEADEIVLLPGWEHSEGATREVALARWLDKDFSVLAKSENDGIGEGWMYRLLDHPPVPDDSPRASALDEAKQLICGDRNNAYGPPTQDFARTADMASAFGFRVNGAELDPHHVAIFMMLLKTSRLAWTPSKRDSWVDAAGYAGCGYECAVS